MFSFLSSKKIKAFGLDISDSSIKVMQLVYAHGRLASIPFTDSPLSEQVVNNHMIISEDRLADNILRAIAAARKIDTKFVVCSVPEAKSFVRTLTIPKMAESEIGTALPFELEQDIPVPVDQVYLDWQIIKDGGDKLEVLAHATPKDYIDALVSSLRKAKLVPVAMELESQATARALISRDLATKSVLIVDPATKLTSFIIVDNGIIQYTSSIPIAGNAFTESISRNLGVTAPQAEKMKQELGLTGDKGLEVRKAILPILDNLVDEIKNVIRFFEEHETTHKSIDTILLCGGSAKLTGIAEYISDRLNLGSVRSAAKVILADPWANVAVDPKIPVPLDRLSALGYTTVIGLALRGVNFNEYSI